MKVKEYLIIGNKIWLSHIDPTEIWYIKSDGNYSVMYLTNGKEIRIHMNLGEVERLINIHLPYYHDDFYRIGKGLIINKTHLYSIDLSSQEVQLFNRRSDGYMTGSTAGYRDGRNDKISQLRNIHDNEVSLPASREALESLKNEIERKTK